MSVHNVDVTLFMATHNDFGFAFLVTCRHNQSEITFRLLSKTVKQHKPQARKIQ